MFENMTPKEIAKQWPLMAALWLMEEPDLIKKNYQLFESAVLSATKEDAVFVSDVYSALDCLAEAAAQNHQCPQDVLDRLCEHRSADVRLWATINPSCRLDVFGKSFVRDVENVRMALAGNAKLPQDLALQLSDDVSYFVRQSLAKNPHLHHKLMLYIAKTENDAQALRFLASNQGANVEVLKTLMDRFVNIPTAKSACILREVMLNALCPTEFHWIALKSSQKNMIKMRGVLRGIAESFKDPDIAKELMGSDDYFVLSALANNANTPFEVLAWLVEEDKTDNGDVQRAYHRLKATQKR